MKDELGRKVMTEFAALRVKICSYLTYDNEENKISKARKKCLIKQKIKFEDCKYC